VHRIKEKGMRYQQMVLIKVDLYISLKRDIQRTLKENLTLITLIDI
jgi:hypothetical protein